MKTKFIILSAVLGGLTLFAWGAIAHMVLPWTNASMNEFASGDAVIEAVKANTTGNGIYFHERGLFAVVAFRPDMGSRMDNMGLYMLAQVLIEIGAAIAIAILLMFMSAGGVLKAALLSTMAGLAASINLHLSYGLWYGFSCGFVVSEMFNMVAGFFLMGLVIGALRNKILPAI